MIHILLLYHVIDVVRDILRHSLLDPSELLSLLLLVPSEFLISLKGFI